jgi:hypothetical protein
MGIGFLAEAGDTGAIDFAYPVGDVRRYGFGSAAATAASNAAAIQRAINNLSPTLGGRVSLPRGTFPVAADVISLVDFRNVTIEGVASGAGYGTSWAGTVLIFEAGDIGINVSCTNHADPLLTAYNVLKNFVVQGCGVLNYGIKVEATQTLDFLSVEGCVIAGVWIGSAGIYSVLNRCSLKGNGTNGSGGCGLLLFGFDATINVIRDCVIRENDIGIYVRQGGSNVQFNSCAIESNYHEGIKIEKHKLLPVGAPSDAWCSDFIFTGCWIENNGFGGTGRYSVFLGNAGSSNPPDNIFFRNCKFEAAPNCYHADFGHVNFVYFDGCYGHGASGVTSTDWRTADGLTTNVIVRNPKGQMPAPQYGTLTDAQVVSHPDAWYEREYTAQVAVAAGTAIATEIFPFVIPMLRSYTYVTSVTVAVNDVVNYPGDTLQVQRIYNTGGWSAPLTFASLDAALITWQQKDLVLDANPIPRLMQGNNVHRFQLLTTLAAPKTVMVTIRFISQ